MFCLKSLFSLVLLSSLILLCSCLDEATFNNKQYRYKVKTPDGWVWLSNTGRSKGSDNFYAKLIENIDSNIDFKSVDVAFYNPDSPPPVYEMITVKSIMSRIDLNNLSEEMEGLKTVISSQLSVLYDQVIVERSRFEPFKQGKLLKLDFSFSYEGQRYGCAYSILPGSMIGTHFISYVYPHRNNDNSSIILDKFIGSFKRY